VSGEQAAARLQEATEQRGGHTERGVGDDVVGTARQTKVAGIGLNHDNPVPEALAEILSSFGMRLDGDHPSAGSDQRNRERSNTGTDVEDVGTRDDAGLSDEPLRPSRVELVPSPPPL
jgi:hypothetical protein